MEFAIGMDLAGTEQLSVAPVGDSNHVELSSTWRSPLFAGRFLPRTREVGGNGFSAAWDVSSLATGTQVQMESNPVKLIDLMNVSLGDGVLRITCGLSGDQLLILFPGIF
jgi:inner membrane protein